jgi:hypothetical protein
MDDGDTHMDDAERERQKMLMLAAEAEAELLGMAATANEEDAEYIQEVLAGWRQHRDSLAGEVVIRHEYSQNELDDFEGVQRQLLDRIDKLDAAERALPRGGDPVRLRDIETLRWKVLARPAPTDDH